MSTKITILGSLSSQPIVLSLPFLSTPVPAGFPSPADDFVDHALDLNELMIKHPAATFFVRVHGDSMIDAGIRSDDILVVDRAYEVTDGCIVVAVIDGEFTVKRLRKDGSNFYLAPENTDFKPLYITDEMDITIWGVVTFVIHAVAIER